MPTAQTDTEGYTWMSIDNFTPGIYSQPSGVGPGPPGAAQDTNNTYGCYATPSGALTPLPGLVANIPAYPIPAGNYFNLVGLFIVPNVLTSGGYGTEIVAGMEEISPAGGLTFWLTSFLGGTHTALAVHTGTGLPTTGGPIHALTGGFTAVNPTTPTSPGSPCLALAWSGAGGAGNHMWLYPDVTNTSLTTVYGFAQPVAGELLCHQNRIVMFTEILSPWHTQQFFNNDTMNYTDPPNSLSTFTSGGSLQNSVFVQENPVGIGTYGSFSAGELMFVKHVGGGAIISGDLNFPTVTYIPGVQPTFGVSSVSSPTLMGLAYLSNNAGVWAWSGDSNSTKLSQALDDQSFNVPLNSATDVTTVGPFFQAYQWGQFIMCSNNYVYDTVTGAWWMLAQQNPQYRYIFFGASTGTGVLYCGNSWMSPTQPNLCDVYSLDTPGSGYSWQSFPMPASIQKVLSIRRVAVRAQGVGTIIITVTSADGSTQNSATLTFSNPSHPTTLLSDLGILSSDIVVTITAQGGLDVPAPTVYSVSLGYNEQHFTSAL